MGLNRRTGLNMLRAMAERPLRVAWISFFPMDWLPDVPEALRRLPRQHPASWQRVLLGELKGVPEVELHVFSVRRHFERSCRFERDGVSFHCVKVPRGLRTFSLFWWETVALRQVLKRVQPDLVHAWGTERAAALVASRLGYPFLVSMQGLLEWYAQYSPPDALGRLEVWLERISLRRASVVTAESSFAVKWLREHYPHLEVRQVEHAPNWLFHRLERRPETRPMQFLHVGALSQLKGTDLLLRGLDKLRSELDFRLTLIGVAKEPGYLDRLKGTTSSALWERINVRHGLTQEEVGEEMARATMVLFPPRVDNSSNSVKEAVAAGVPVVASAVGGAMDYVVSGKNGVGFPAGDLQAFVEAIRRAAADPLFSQGKVAPETLQQMREYLSPRRMADGMLAAYRRVAELSCRPKTSAGRVRSL
jgi:glycosyltransferase involved in cell wall biosynthesis